MSGELFKGVKQWEFDWQGRKAKLPVFYYDNTSLTEIFTASTEKVRRLLPHPEMRPIEMYPGRCIVAFTGFEYRQSDIDPYNEFSIAFLVSFGKTTVPGLTAGLQLAHRSFTAYIWKLPVTTEIARVGGVELYGYPKFLADITFQREAGHLTCTLAEKGKLILKLKGKTLPAKRGKLIHYTTYSVLEGIPLAANVYIDPIQYAETMDRKAATLELGDHEIASELKKIDMGPAPLIYQYSPVTEAILFGGRNLIDN